MDHNFLQWLHVTHAPGRFDVLSASLESIGLSHGLMLEHWTQEMMANLAYQDTSNLQMIVEQNTLNFQNETLSQFGVWVELELMTPEHTHRYDKMLRALYAADEYEMPGALLSVLSGDQSPVETFGEVVAEICGGDADDYILLLREVKPALLTKIRQLAEIKLQQQQEAQEPDYVPEDLETQSTRNSIFALIEEWGEDNPITRYVKDNGKLGLDLERYVVLFEPYLGSVTLNFETHSAKAWVLIAMMSSLWKEPSAVIVDSVSAHFNNVYGNVLRCMKVRNALVIQLKEYKA